MDIGFAPSADEMYPPGFQTWVEVTGARVDPRRAVPPGPLPRSSDGGSPLLTIVRPTHIYFAARMRSRRWCVAYVRDLAVEIEVRALPTVRDADGLSALPLSRNVLLSPRARGRSRFHGRSRRGASSRPAPSSRRTVAVDYVEAAEFDPPVLAGAVRVGRPA